MVCGKLLYGPKNLIKETQLKGHRGFALIILLTLTGCSGTGIESPNIPTSGSDNPVVPGHIYPETGGSDRTILAIGSIDINPDTLTTTFLPSGGR